ncbi:hypothetical protein EDB89DRAFT_2032453 [Lactarius sanguifluus]|nr:hypothetical protein EDB89DRAFT_2032453 [Lactarius sanguifluus]
MSSPAFANFGLSEYEKRVRDHGLLAAIAFLVIIPVGVLIPRYLRTFTNRWFWGHAITNFLISGPLVFAAWAMGSKAGDLTNSPMDHHKRIGYVIFGLYIGQVVLGTFIHYVRIPFPFLGHRPPQNYIHALLGIVILAMANYQVRPCPRYLYQQGFFSFESGKQVHYGIYVEWPLMTGDVHPVKQSAKHAWLALVIVFWSLYVIGLVFLPRQYTQEREGRSATDKATDKEAS